MGEKRPVSLDGLAVQKLGHKNRGGKGAILRGVWSKFNHGLTKEAVVVDWEEKNPWAMGTYKGTSRENNRAEVFQGQTYATHMCQKRGEKGELTKNKDWTN